MPAPTTTTSTALIAQLPRQRQHDDLPILPNLAVQRLEQNARLAAGLGHASGDALALAILALARQDGAEHAEASRCADEALRLTQDDVGTWPALVAHVCRGQVAVAQADWTRAEIELQTALALGSRCETTLVNLPAWRGCQVRVLQ